MGFITSILITLLTEDRRPSRGFSYPYVTLNSCPYQRISGRGLPIFMKVIFSILMISSLLIFEGKDEITSQREERVDFRLQITSSTNEEGFIN